MARTLLVAIGVAVGAAIGAGLYVVLEGDEPAVNDTGPVEIAFPPVDHDESAASDLLSAWERWRTATFYARGTWARRLDEGGEPLQGPVLVVQDPPRRLVIRLGSLVEQIDGTSRACDAEIEGAVAPPCVANEVGLDYEERVAAELATVEGYVRGEARPFDVGRGDDDGCFRAENRGLLAAAPWGLWAEFCFDEATGALASARVRRESAVDTEVMIEIRAEVTDADFEP